MKVKFQIKNSFGSILFELEKENNSLKETVQEAIKQNAYLSDANLYGADLRSAYLYGADLRSAYLSDANLYGADLRSAYLYGADLRSAYLSDANLYGADLRSAYLYGADLRSADLRSADLSGANLYGADLRSANLYGANLYGADLRSAYLRGADLSDEEKEKIRQKTTHLTDGGDIIGYKKVNNHIIKLLIPADAKKCHAIGSRKCRAEYVKVLEISGNLSKIENTSYVPYVTYKVGEIVKPDSYDPDILTECSHGINFFISKIEAEEY
jgi:hypothetical protein